MHGPRAIIALRESVGTVMRIRQWSLGSLAAGISCLLLAGCSLSIFGPSAQDLATGAYRSLNGASTVHLTGQFTSRAKAYTIDVVLQPKRDGQAAGSGSYSGIPFKYLAAGGTTYVAGQQFWQAVSGDPKMARGYGEKWVIATPDTPVAAALDALHDLGGIETQLNTMAARMQKGNEATIDGTRVSLVTDGEVTYYISESAPMRLLRLQLAKGRITAEGLSNVRLDLHYDAPLKASSPAAGQFVDPNDPATLPAHYTLASASGLQNCDENTCGFTATVQNDSGAPEGQTVATLSLFKDATSTTLIGSCQVNVPPLQHAQTGDVTCRISGPGYAAFYASIAPGGQAPVYKDVTFKNPPYDT
jgi:hypothetical protein